MLDGSLISVFVKAADDPDQALMTRVKGLKIPRMATPRLRKGTKGQVPVNPFSGNWAKAAAKKLEIPIPDLSNLSFDPGHAALGMAAILGGGALAGRTLKNIVRPPEKTKNLRAQSGAIHVARGVQSALGSQF